MRARRWMALRAMAALVGLVLLQASAAAQQCWFDVWEYHDFNDNGVDQVQVYGDAWDTSYCPGCSHWGHTLFLSASGPDGAASDEFSGGSGVLPLHVQTSGTVFAQGHYRLTCGCGGLIEVTPLFTSQVVVQRPPPPSPPCRPNLKSGALFRHGYKAHAHPLWPSFPSWISDGANHWNTFVAQHGAVAPAFTNYVGGTGPLTLDIFVDDTIHDWGLFFGGMIGTMRISPQNWWQGTWEFTLSTILHEFGDAQNYADAPFCDITETVMYDVNISPDNYPPYFLPGDHRAAAEDIALYPH